MFLRMVGEYGPWTCSYDHSALHSDSTSRNDTASDCVTLKLGKLFENYTCTKVGFCGICQRRYHYEFNMVFRKSCNSHVLFKTKEVDPINSISP